MTNTYKEEKGNKHKKLLVPLVALLLCAAAMIGVGYAALASDVTNTGNTIEMEGITLELKNGADVQTAGAFNNSTAIKFESHTLNGTRTSTVANNGVIGTGTLTINSTHAIPHAKMTNAFTATVADPVVPFPTGMTFDIVLKKGVETVTMTDFALDAGTNVFTVELKAILGSSFTIPTSATSGATTVPVSFDVKITVETLTP